MVTNNAILSSLLLTVSMVSGIQCLKIQGSGSYFKTKRITNNVNQTLVATTFNAKDFMGCAFRCSRYPAYVSLYYDEGNATCHCNNGTDDTAALSTVANSLVYAYKVRIALDVTSGSGIGCIDVHDAGYRTRGIYEIHSSDSSATKELHCDPAHQWTVFQKRFDGSVDFYRPWDDYVNGFGSPPDGEFWLGLETIHSLTATGSCELMIHMEAEPDHPDHSAGFARYSSFSVGSASANFTLNISGFSGNVGDSMSNGDQCQFSTFDREYDEWTADNCAAMDMGAWWYRYCNWGCLNGLYLNGRNDNYSQGVNWFTGWGFWYSLLKTEMKIKCV